MHLPYSTNAAKCVLKMKGLFDYIERQNNQSVREVMGLGI